LRNMNQPTRREKTEKHKKSGGHLLAGWVERSCGRTPWEEGSFIIKLEK